jgi:flagellar biosynthesis/type III secretory pathway protein FliH
VPSAEAREAVGPTTAAGPLQAPEPAPERSTPAPDPAAVAANEALSQAVRALESAIEESRRAQLEERRRWLWGALEIALALARRVLERELAIDPAALRPLIERALELLADSGPVEVALAPASLAVLESDLARPEGGPHGGSQLRFRADPNRGAGEARVRAESARVEVRLDSLLEMLRQELVPEWEKPLA